MDGGGGGIVDGGGGSPPGRYRWELLVGDKSKDVEMPASESFPGEPIVCVDSGGCCRCGSWFL